MKIWVKESYIRDILLYLNEGESVKLTYERNNKGVDGYTVEFKKSSAKQRDDILNFIKDIAMFVKE